MKSEPIILHLDRSTPAGLCLERDGKPVAIEEAFEQGFVVTKDDAAAVLSWAHSFIQTTTFNQC